MSEPAPCAHACGVHGRAWTPACAPRSRWTPAGAAVQVAAHGPRPRARRVARQQRRRRRGRRGGRCLGARRAERAAPRRAARSGMRGAAPVRTRQWLRRGCEQGPRRRRGCGRSCGHGPAAARGLGWGCGVRYELRPSSRCSRSSRRDVAGRARGRGPRPAAQRSRCCGGLLGRGCRRAFELGRCGAAKARRGGRGACGRCKDGRARAARVLGRRGHAPRPGAPARRRF